MVKKSVFFLISLIMVLTLFIGCGAPSKAEKPSASATKSASESSPAAQSSSSAPAAQSTSKPLTIGYIMGNQTMEFFLKMKAGVESSIKDGDKLVTYSFDDDPTKESGIFDDLIVKKVDIIIANMLDGESIYPSLVKAQKAGIPVIMLDGLPDGDKFKGLFVTGIIDDLYDAGYQQGKYLSEALGGKGKIGMIWIAGLPDYFNQRVKGFKDAVAEHKDIEIAAYNEVSGVDTETCLQAISAQLQVHADLNGYFTPWANAGLAAVSALATAKMSNVKLAVNDINKTIAQYVADGKAVACMDLNSSAMGKKAVEIAYKYLSGEKITETVTKVKCINVDKSNVADYLK